MLKIKNVVSFYIPTMNYYTENLKKPKNTTYEPLTQFQNLYIPYK